MLNSPIFPIYPPQFYLNLAELSRTYSASHSPLSPPFYCSSCNNRFSGPVSHIGLKGHRLMVEIKNIFEGVRDRGKKGKIGNRALGIKGRKVE
jgi:hypothetical protein